VQNRASFSTSLNSEPSAFKNAARHPNAKTNTFLCRNDRPISSPSSVKLGLCIPENCWAEMPHSITARQKCAKSSITQLWIIRFRSNFVQSLNTRHQKCCKSLRSRGRRPKNKHKMCKNRQNYQ